MTTNNSILLNLEMQRHRQQIGELLSNGEYQAFFVAKLFLQHYRVSHEELIDGIVDGHNDCGIDAIYLFANGAAVRDDISLSSLGRNVDLDLVIIQVKDSTGFGEDAVMKLQSYLPQLLEMKREEQALRAIANERVLERTRRFLNACHDLEMPRLRMFIAFASLRASMVHPNVVKHGQGLERTLGRLFFGSSQEVSFYTTEGILDLARQPTRSTRKLQLAEIPLSTDRQGGFIGVVRLHDYDRFITNEDGALDTTLFEANVRDYEGDVNVNKSIQMTLSQTADEIDFWWLNNGVTIVAESVQQASKLLELQNPYIVNGLQTSTEIFKRDRNEGAPDDRSLLVKIIIANDEAVRDRIIRATNSQTSLGLSALRATDRKQRDIEEYLSSRGLFYERRKNYYFNQGKPISSLVSIDQLAQAVLSILVQLPHIARGQAGRIYEEEVYDCLFALENPLALYSACLSIVRQCEEHIARQTRRDRGTIEDMKYHLAMIATIFTSKTLHPSAVDIASMDGDPLSRETLATGLAAVRLSYDEELKATGLLLLDQLAKSSSVTDRLLSNAAQAITSRKRRPNAVPRAHGRARS